MSAVFERTHCLAFVLVMPFTSGVNGREDFFNVFFMHYCLAAPLDISRKFMCMYLILPNITFMKRLRVKSKKKYV